MTAKARRRGAADTLADVALTDHGDAIYAGTANATHTIAAPPSTGPATVVFVSWAHISARTLLSATFGGNALLILEQNTQDPGSGERVGCAICLLAGAQSGDVVLNFSGTTNDSGITVASLENLISPTPVDTDIAGGDSGATGSLAALASPGAGGIRLFVVSAGADTSSASWNLGTMIADFDADGQRHSAGYHLADAASTITATVGSGVKALCGVSLR